MVATLLCATALSLFAQEQKSAAVLMQAAAAKETIQSDLAGAAALYEQAIAQAELEGNRALTASALVAAGELYLKLSDPKAMQRFGRVVREFSDYPDVAARARGRLEPAAATRRAGISGPVCSNCVGPYFHSFTLSADGRWFGYTVANNDLMARDVATGEIHRLVSFPAASYETMRFRARRATWSRDGRQVAYTVRELACRGCEPRSQLRVMSADGEGETRTLVDNLEFNYIIPKGWSPDGKSILVITQRRDFTWQLAWVSAASGEMTLLRSLQWQFDEFRNGPALSPDGRYLVYATFAQGQDSPGSQTPAQSAAMPTRHLHILAADGARQFDIPAGARGMPSPIWSADGTKILFLSDRGSGVFDLWSMEVREGQPASQPELVRAAIGINLELVGTTREGLLYYVQPQSSARRTVVANLATDPAPTTSTATPGLPGSNASWSPDGTRLAWRSVEAPQTVVAYTVATGQAQSHTFPAGSSLSGPTWVPDGSALLVGVMARDTPPAWAISRIDLATFTPRVITTYAPPAGEWWGGPFTPGPDGRSVLARVTHESTSGERVISVDLETGTARALSHLSGVPRLQTSPRSTVGQAWQISRTVTRALSASAGRDGGRLAVTVLKDGEAYVATTTVQGDDYREVYGPVPARSWDGTNVSPFSDPRWLQDGRSIAVGIQQDDFSWKFVRVSGDGRAEPFSGAPNFVLPADTLRFDINPDGRHIAYERMMTFTGELWALDLSPLLKKPR